MFALVFASAFLLAGCAQETRTPLTPAAFAASDPAPSDAPPPLLPPAPGEEPDGTGDDETDLVERTADDIARLASRPRAHAGQPDDQSIRGGISPEYLLVDGKIGDVNGRPIFARRFFESQQLEGPLRLLADELLDRGVPENRLVGIWRQEARGIISRTLSRVVRDEVLYRERVSTLTSQGAGLRIFLQLIREQVRRQSYGSLESADEYVRSRQGGEDGLDAFLQNVNRQQAIDIEIEQRVRSRVSVSWREIVNYYNRNDDVFNPPPKASVRLIQLPSAKQDIIDEVIRRLESGESFADVASDPLNLHQSEAGGLFRGDPVEFEGAFAEATIINDEALNGALTSLAPGQWTGPITDGLGGDAWAWFVALDGIETQNQSLYDAQLGIEGEIRKNKTARATNRYLSTLIGESSHTDIAIMTERLLEYAERAYLDPWTGQPEG